MQGVKKGDWLKAAGLFASIIAIYRETAGESVELDLILMVLVSGLLFALSKEFEAQDKAQERQDVCLPSAATLENTLGVHRRLVCRACAADD